MRSRQSSGHGTFQGGSEGYPEDNQMDMQDLKSPHREVLHEIRSGGRKYNKVSATTNNSNLRSATNMQMNQAFVQLGDGSGVGDPRCNPGVQVAAIDNGQYSRTNTDDAGGEAFDHEDLLPSAPRRGLDAVD